MLRRLIGLSSFNLDMSRDRFRLPPRPCSVRHVDYEDNFDFNNVFQDCFWDESNTNIFIVGPPAFNLWKDLQLEILALPSLAPCRIESIGSIWITRCCIHPPPATTALVIKTTATETFITPQPNMANIFVNRRTITTMSKNNELPWIRDWVYFYNKYHGCDGALIYDNNSDKYSVNQLYDSLAPLADDIEIVVLSWPFKYGAADWRYPLSYTITDSIYCQAGMLEHARRRFLSKAKSVSNPDIDELIITEGDRSAFELAECSETGLVELDGRWVENLRRKDTNSPDAVPRFRDFSYVRRSRFLGSESKWIVVPTRVPELAQWHIHHVRGMVASCPRHFAEIRHFRAINTNWNIDRHRSLELRALNCAEGHADGEYEIDLALRTILDRIFADEPTPPQSPDQQPLWRAYSDRVAANEYITAKQMPEALAHLSRALSVMPDHAGIHDLLARLYNALGDDSRAETFTKSAARIRSNDDWYNFKRGCWFQDECDWAVAREYFERTLAINPQFSLAYKHLIDTERRAGGADRTLELLERWRSNMPASAIAHADLAVAFEREWLIDPALRSAQSAVSLESNNARFCALLGRLWMKAGEIGAAEEQVRKGLACNLLVTQMAALGERSTFTGFYQEVAWYLPLASEPHVLLVELLARKGDGVGAITVARDANAYVHLEVGQLLKIGRLLEDLGAGDQAALYFQRAKKRASHVWQYLIWNYLPKYEQMELLASRACDLADSITAVGERAEAIAFLRTEVAFRGDFRLREKLAFMLGEEGEINEANGILEGILKEASNNGRAMRRLSRLVREFDMERAIALAREAVALQPRQPWFLYDLAELLIRNEGFEEAEVALERSASFGFRSARLYHLRGRVRARTGDMNGALVCARAAAELDHRYVGMT